MLKCNVFSIHSNYTKVTKVWDHQTIRLSIGLQTDSICFEVLPLTLCSIKLTAVISQNKLLFGRLTKWDGKAKCTIYSLFPITYSSSAPVIKNENIKSLRRSRARRAHHVLITWFFFPLFHKTLKNTGLSKGRLRLPLVSQLKKPINIRDKNFTAPSEDAFFPVKFSWRMIIWNKN